MEHGYRIDNSWSYFDRIFNIGHFVSVLTSGFCADHIVGVFVLMAKTKFVRVQPPPPVALE